MRRLSSFLRKAGDDARHGPYRRAFLDACGFQIAEVDELPMQGVLMDPRDPYRARAFIELAHATADPTAFATCYRGPRDAAAINALADMLTAKVANPDAPPTYAPKLKEGGDERLRSALRRVKQYSNSDAIEIRSVPLRSVVSLTKCVREYKILQSEYLVDLYRANGIPIFSPCALTLSEGRFSLITPPVLEESGANFVLVEGSSRAVYCRDQGIDEFTAVVIRGVKDPLPSQCCKFDSVRVVKCRLDVEARYSDFNYDAFRHIESTVHSIAELNGGGM